MSDAHRILIVDDEPNIRQTFRTALESAGHGVAEAADVAEALAYFGEHVADLALIDLRMPGEGGMGLLRRLREAGDLTPVVIVSAHGMVPDAVQAMRLGAIDVLQKPIDPDALRCVAAEVIDRHAPAPAPVEAALDAEDVGEEVALSRAKRALNRREFDEAEGFLRRAIDAHPASGEAHNLLGVLHTMRGDLEAARRSFRMARFIDANDPTARNNLIRCEELLTYGSSRRELEGLADATPDDDTPTGRPGHRP
ncbi:response regulator [Tautonia plasticadhaerens]|uniref:Alginate biosynthesis transcriptional regulatory protein AlgB n=1 Tax=Tautonia plasticadhaerens TaxID=2527974 RepID=A0A518HEA5_9BACT|nr:response regulator [Tautonia plasticadhaerens]QDV39184.1 Alginate biosynthesis transcriptional regulatory protein AlgB [Tautonia plasticadhaerens]